MCRHNDCFDFSGAKLSSVRFSSRGLALLTPIERQEQSGRCKNYADGGKSVKIQHPTLKETSGYKIQLNAAQ